MAPMVEKQSQAEGRRGGGHAMGGARGRHHVCPPFSCGGFHNISYPFRRQGDPSGCGDRSYELVCTDTSATIGIGRGSYNVLSINYTCSYFWVIDANLNMQSHCPLPWWDYHDDDWKLHGKSHRMIELDSRSAPAIFVNCCKRIENNGIYKPVACLSTDSSFIYVMVGASCSEYCYYTPDFYSAGKLEPSCGYLTKTFLGGPSLIASQNTSYPDVGKFMRKGFALQFPFTISSYRSECFTEFMRFVLGPVAILIFLAHKYWKTRIAIDAVEKFLRMQLMLGGPLRFAYTDLTAITSHFKERLGQGGYGSVYKGLLLPGEVQIAVKMLSNSKCNGEEFINEVSTIGRIHHVNVVRLVGFCSEEMRRALVYEYMPNGSLDKYIFSPEKSFSWGKLNEIALGIARGINYLHQGCDMQIVHFDIKPHNILLDNNFVPKVADFGLAKLCPRDNNFVPLSAMRGTIGYIAPEMVSRSFGVISSKSDVYSFGILLLEMTGGRRNADPRASSSGHAYYPSMVYSLLSQQDAEEVGEGVDMHELEKKLCIVGLWCIQMKPQDRPTMSEVIEMLEVGIGGLQVPPRPFFCDDEVEGSYNMPSELNVVQEEDV